MTMPAPGISVEATSFNWLVNRFADGTAGAMAAIAVSADGLLIAMSAELERDNADRLAAISSAMIGLANGVSESYPLGGPDKVTVALVVHGPALKAFHAKSANPEHVRQIRELARVGVEFAACGKMMAVQNVALKDLVPGFLELEQGGVVRLAELQSQGYVYLRL